MHTLLTRAQTFAERAHAGQRRKYTGEPYISHPREVANLLVTCSSKAPTEEMLAAAWLHDVVEDTPTTLNEIKAMFGPVVSSLVSDLTNISRPGDGNRVVRKAIDRAHTALACPEAKSIKLADVISNTRNIARDDYKFANVYLPEKLLLLEVLKNGDEQLWAIANSVIHDGLQHLEVIERHANDHAREYH